jgi:hypothetical protein
MNSSGLFGGFTLPLQGWKRDGSTSIGGDELYRGRRDVLVRTFSEAEPFEAYGTHWFLKESGVTSTDLAKVQHVDGSWHYYVFADRSELLATQGELYEDDS